MRYYDFQIFEKAGNFLSNIKAWMHTETITLAA
jgi:hypothetical protein